MARNGRLAAVVLCAALVLGACGKGGDDNGVASLSGGSTSTTVTGKTGSQKHQRDALVDYTRCLRQHGVEVSDPTFGSNGPSGNGGLRAGAAGGNSGAVIANGAGSISLPSPDDPAFKAADKVCQPILKRSQQDVAPPSPAEQAKARDHALAFAKCMREHGIDMPDPTFNSEGHISISIPGPKGGDPTGPMPQAFQDAQQACQHLMDLPGGGPGDGPSSQTFSG
jgi:hypothetical protein